MSLGGSALIASGGGGGRGDGARPALSDDGWASSHVYDPFAMEVIVENVLIVVLESSLIVKRTVS